MYVAGQFREWSKKNKEHRKRYMRNWSRKNRNHINEYHKKNRNIFRETERRYRKRLRNAVIALLGLVCSRCGFSDFRALQIDHRKGCGHQERLLLKTSSSIYRKILKMKHPESEYQLLCANCNWIKRVENEEFAGSGS